MMAVMACAACTQDPEESLSVTQSQSDVAAARKLVFSAQEAAGGELLICFDDAAAEIAGTSVTRAGVATRSGIETLDMVFDNAGVTSFEPLFKITPQNEARVREAGMHRWFIVRFDEKADLETVAMNMARVGEVLNVEFSQIYRRPETLVIPMSEVPRPAGAATRAAVRFNDPDLVRQWHYINTGDVTIYQGIKEGADVNCGEAWQYCAGDPRVVVAVIDEPVDWTHRDLADNMWVNTLEQKGREGEDDDNNGYKDDIHGFDFYKNQPLTVGGIHGTHVAGTISAVNNNNIGVCGIAGGTGNKDGVRIMSCQIGDPSAESMGGAAVISRAFQYAADNGAVIAQCSWGVAYKFTSDRSYWAGNSAEKAAIEYFISTSNCAALEGGLVIFAAGNDGLDYSSYPGGAADFISVSSISCSFAPAYYTNYGRGVNIAAPGGDYRQGNAACILSTLPNNDYGFQQGTSMACPHMSGVAALGLSYALQKGKKFTLDEYKTLLLTSVNDVNSYMTGNYAKYYGNMGTGYTDALQVLMNVEGTPCVPVRLGVRQSISVESIFGGGASDLTYLDVSMSAADKTKLGVEGEISMSQTGKFQIKCNKPGSGRVKVKFIAGGNVLGGDNQTGGMEVTKEFVVIARGVAANGGWL